MKEGRRQGFPFPKHIERYTAKRRTSEAGKPSSGLAKWQVEQQPHDGGVNKPEPLPPKDREEASDLNVDDSVRPHPPSMASGFTFPRGIRFSTSEEILAELTPEQKARLCFWTDSPSAEELLVEIRKR